MEQKINEEIKEINSSPQKDEERIIRILSTDIEGKMKIFPALTKIKGISWSFSNAICKILKINKNQKIGSLNDEETKKVVEFIKNPSVPKFILNRRIDFETGKDKHIIGVDLELQNEFDIKRLKKIKSYKGYRHMSKLTVRGQRTRGNFRKNRAKGVGIKKKSKKS